MNEEEIKEMSEGGRPYTPQQNEVAEARKEQPKLPSNPVRDNGEKLYKKCPTCGSFMEVNANPVMTQPRPIIPQQPQVNNGRVINQLILPMPQDIPKPVIDKIESDERLPDGKPTVEAQWDEPTSKIPNTPLR